jgi:hypothetical protein
MSNLAIHEIITEVTKIKQKVDKADFLKKHNSRELRNVLKVWYDKNLEFNIPSTAPPYEPSKFPDNQGMLYREARKLTYFVKGFDGDNLSQMRREQLFIQILEAVHPDDAKLLVQVISKKPVKGLTIQTINMAFPGMIPVDEDVKEEADE